MEIVQKAPSWMPNESKKFVHSLQVIPVTLAFSWSAHDGKFASPWPTAKFSHDAPQA